MEIRVINGGKTGHDDLKRMVEENAVIVFARKGCCLSHVVKCLLRGLGANPTAYEVEEKDLNGVVLELEEKVVGSTLGGGGGKEGRRLQFPAVFIGGQWFGGLDRIMAAHITGELTPMLKQAGALWL
ncbi:hypothetical protein RD792_007057 [Penstemon davidsonii]|uniref:Glutaredoxin domain-containing protein n=1 Tax=Penstemon davidsonii TaxID=160366 RepID=A0ABR0D5E2_9LAMI|nr:hypothetical protein RD792_007057 [Penstemon davidsonii]